MAREIRTLVGNRTSPKDIVLTCRHPSRLRTIVREVFAEYDVPLDDPTPTMLNRHPAVAFLLAAWSVPAAEFPFAAVTAMLRNSWFQPRWSEVVSDPDLPLRAETLLRALAIPRGRTAYLAAVAKWATELPLPLEDEAGERRRWNKLHALAGRCRPFLERFFALWDQIPERTTTAEFVNRLIPFADACGLPGNEPAWERLRTALLKWADDTPMSPIEFARAMTALAAKTPGPSEPRCDGVRFLEPDIARTADCEHLFLIDLGEGSFPDPQQDLAAERELFAELIARPRTELHLSYPAVDPKGEKLLPASLLRTVEAKVTRTTSRSMPIDGYTTDPPISAAEVRVQAAAVLADDGTAPANRLPPAVLANLLAARTAARARFRSPAFGAYDGRLTHPEALKEVTKRFHAEQRISPTALETYVACPFRFLLEKFLNFEPHEDPVEEVEITRRGSAVHRAMARLHRDDGDATTFPDELAKHLDDVVAESQDKAAGPVERKLWELEGRRLARIAKRYAKQCDKFDKPWVKLNVAPKPCFLEPALGVQAEEGAKQWPDLVLERDGIRVKIGGRIDRVDAVELDGEVGFWVIDYKTGKGGYYTGTDVQSLKKLQLPLYALAVERVLFEGRPARPLGVAYWLITDVGPKVMLPSYKQPTAWYQDRKVWEAFREALESWVIALATRIRAGDFSLAPRSDDCTATCPYGPVCRIGPSRQVAKDFGLPLPMVDAPIAGDA